MTIEEALGALGLVGAPSLRQIRGAYAALVKEHHPEEDPGGFAYIREAYQAALRQARKVDEAPPADAGERTPAAGMEAGTGADFDFSILRQKQEEHLDEKQRRIIGRMDEIYQVVEFRRDVGHWDICFRMKAFREIKKTQAFHEACLAFFDGHRHFPGHVWNFLCRVLGLPLLLAGNAAYQELEKYIGQALSVPVKYRSTYAYMRSTTPPGRLDGYLEQVTRLQTLFTRGEAREAGGLFWEAARYLEGDLELYEIAARFFMEDGDRAQARRICDAALGLDSDTQRFEPILQQLADPSVGP